MYKTATPAVRDFVSRENIMRKLYQEGTGSVHDASMSDPYQGVPRMWSLLQPADPELTGNFATTSGVIFIIKNATAQASVVTCAVLSPASVVEQVRDVFGLNISETAAVFGVTRQTLYQWLKLTEMDSVRSAENRHRIRQLYNAAELWSKSPALKAGWLHAILPGGHSLYDLLQAEQIDMQALSSAHLALVETSLVRREEEGRRATQAAEALALSFDNIGAGRKAGKE